jgi:hypothetical protein
MKKLLAIAVLAIFTTTNTNATTIVNTITSEIPSGTKYDIKLKNDSGDEFTVYNAGSGGTYRLQKNVVTTIKMEDGDKLYTYEGGKKGKLLLTAAADMDGKVQLLSKL